MTDSLFDLPPQQPDALEAARRRFAAAEAAFDAANAAAKPDEAVLREFCRARVALVEAEAAELRRRGGRA